MTIWKHIRNIIIHVVSICGIAFLYRKFLQRRGPLVRVLVFHDVFEKEWFDGIIDTLRATCHFVTPEEFQSSQFDSEKINILLTFDDGYQSWIEAVLPSLAERDIKAIFFVNSDLLDLANDESNVTDYITQKLKRTVKKTMTWEGAIQLCTAGHTIGGHSASHPNLAMLSDAELHEELRRDKERTESKLGITLTQFAYPFGKKEYYTREVIQAVRDLGYTHAYTAESGFVTFEDSDSIGGLYEIPRLGMENVLTPKRVLEWARGGYDIVQILK